MGLHDVRDCGAACRPDYVIVRARPQASDLPMNIVIQGESVAAWCCAHLLKAAGLKPVLRRTARARLPAIMLSAAALTLIRDVFGRPDLFLTAPRITRPTFRWRSTTPPS